MPEHLSFGFDLSPDPKPHILSFRSFGGGRGEQQEQLSAVGSLSSAAGKG